MQHQATITFALPEGLTLGGVTTLSVEISRRLAKQGQPVNLIEHSTMYGNPRLDFNLPPEVRVIDCTHLPHPDDPRIVVADYLLAYRSILPGVIIPNWSYGTFAACALLAAEAPESLRVIGYAHTDEAGYYQWLSYYQDIIHRFVAVSQEIAANLSRLLPQRQDDIIIRPYAVNIPAQLHRVYSEPEKPLQLVYAGRISERQKRVFDLVYLTEALAREGVNFQLRIIGDGNDREALRRKLEALSPIVRQRVSLENSLPPQQLPAIWQSADIFVLVSEYEGTSISMLEAMAQGCVPVVTKVSGTNAVIQQGVNGFYVPVGAIGEMAHFIKILDDNRVHLANMGHHACTTIEEQFGYDEYIHWFLQMVEEVWGEPPRPWPSDRPLLRPGQPVSIPLSVQPGLEQAIIPAEIVGNLSGEDVARLIPIKKIIKAIGFKIAAKHGFRWLYRYKGLGKKLLGG